MLYRKHNFLNKNVDFLVSNEIIEYDIKSAGFNIMKKYKLLPDYQINYLERLDKKRRQVQIGLYTRDNRELAKLLNEKFVEVRQWFFEQNGLKDEEVLSIKKDAIIALKRCLVTELDNIQFVEKNIYTSYYYLNGYEFYYNTDKVDVKGISDDELSLHKEFMLDFLYQFFKMNEISSKKKVIELLQEFAHYYKHKKLEIGYYRELNEQSLFRLQESLFNNSLGIRDVGDVNKIDISYNYLHYLIPLISILI